MARNPSIRRRRTVLRKIENKDDRLISFSKRRSGIYKKASELTSLSNAKIGILMFSECDKPYSFGAPDFKTISNHFRGAIASSSTNSPTNNTLANIMHAFKQGKSYESNHEYADLCNRLKISKKDGVEISKTFDTIKSQLWWETPLEDLTQQQMDQLTDLMEKIGVKCDEKKEELLLSSNTSS